MKERYFIYFFIHLISQQQQNYKKYLLSHIIMILFLFIRI